MAKTLCFKRDQVEELMDKQLSGVAPGNSHPKLFDLNYEWLEHDELSKNDDYLHPIVYVNLYVQNPETGLEFFTYTRGSKTRENALSGKTSIGVGGHIDDQLEGEDYSVIETIAHNAARELVEEVGYKDWDVAYRTILTLLEQGHFILIYDGSSEVGRVHLGLGVSIKISKEDITAFEKDEIADPAWIPPFNLLKPKAEPLKYEAPADIKDFLIPEVDDGNPGYTLENWSEMFLYHLMQR